MRIIHTIRVILLLIMSLSTSCQKDPDYISNENTQGHIIFTDISSRSSQDGNFEQGDAIGVFVINPSTGEYWGTNNKYVYDGQKFNPATESDDIIVTKGANFDFYVYYPYKENQTDITRITHSSGDQDTEEGWISSDLLTATYTESITDYTIPLNFYHRYATVEVHVNQNDGITAATLKNVQYMSSTNLLTGNMTIDESRKNVKMYCYNENNNGNTIFRVTIPAQVLTTTSNHVSLFGNTNIDLRAESTMTLLPGKIQQYSISYKKNIRILDYTPGGSTTGAGYYNIGSQCTVTAIPNSGYEFAGWYENNTLLSTSQSYSFKVLGDHTLEPRYRNYSSWVVSISAAPTQIATSGGTSAITASAVRNVYINGNSSGTENGTVILSSNNSAFVIEGTTVRVGENTTTSTRTAIITASCGGVSNSVTLTQPGRTESYVFSINGGTSVNYTAASSGGSVKYTIVSQKTSIVDGTSTTVTANWSASWNVASFGSLSNDGTLIIAENPTTSLRSAVITLTQEGSGKQITITVLQQKKNSVDIED